jgi:hypothetical protein
MYRNLVVGLIVVGIVSGLGSTLAMADPAEEAAKAFAKGRTMLAGADFDGALEAFKIAATTDKANQEYRQQFAMLRRVMQMRSRIEGEQNPEHWESMARALRNYYHEHAIFSEALPLDTKRQSERPCTDSAVMLAETQLALGMDAEVIETLGSLGKAEATPQAKVLMGIAYAHRGYPGDAKHAAGHLGLPADAAPDVCFQFARLHALIGDNGQALAALRQSFERTPPSRLDDARADAESCADFASLAGSPEFAEALATPSTIQESGCSGGAGCGSCPKRAKSGGCGGCAAKRAAGEKPPCQHDD